MAKRKRIFTKYQSKAKRKKIARRNETEEEREIRLTLNREYSRRLREIQNESQRENFREEMRRKQHLKRKREKDEQRQMQNEQSRERMKTLRRNQRIDLECEAFHYDPTIEYNKHPNIVIGKMDQTCRFCGAKKYKNETPSMCCKSGKVKLLSLQAPPHELFKYMTGETPESKHFLRNIRPYNACFQMTSFGAPFIHESDGFNSVFKVQGQIYHRVGSLLPFPNETPKFLQVYFMGDNQLEFDQRCANIKGLRREIIRELQDFLHEHNRLIVKSV